MVYKFTVYSKLLVCTYKSLTNQWAITLLHCWQSVLQPNQWTITLFHGCSANQWAITLISLFTCTRKHVATLFGIYCTVVKELNYEQWYIASHMISDYIDCTKPVHMVTIHFIFLTHPCICSNRWVQYTDRKLYIVFHIPQEVISTNNKKDQSELGDYHKSQATMLHKCKLPTPLPVPSTFSACQTAPEPVISCS